MTSHAPHPVATHALRAVAWLGAVTALVFLLFLAQTGANLPRCFALAAVASCCALVIRDPLRSARLLVARPAVPAVAQIALLVFIVVDHPLSNPLRELMPASVVACALFGRPRWAITCAAVAGLVFVAVVYSTTPVPSREAAEPAIVAATWLGLAITIALPLSRFHRFVGAIHDAARLEAPATGQAALPGSRPKPASSRELSSAELTVVGRLAAGLSPQQIAVSQFVSLSTVRSHIRSAKRASGARTLNELVALHALGLTGPPVTMQFG